jgi:hypothetical protein
MRPRNVTRGMNHAGKTIGAKRGLVIWTRRGALGRTPWGPLPKQPGDQPSQHAQNDKDEQDGGKGCAELILFLDHKGLPYAAAGAAADYSPGIYEIVPSQGEEAVAYSRLGIRPAR